jgi:hypothetical protein
MGHSPYPRSAVLVLGQSSVYSLLPSTLFAQVESFLQNGRLAEAEALLDRADVDLAQGSTSSGDQVCGVQHADLCALTRMRPRRHYTTCTNASPSRSCVRPDFKKQQPTSSGEPSILVSLSLTSTNYGLLCSVNLRATRMTIAQLYELVGRILPRLRSGMALESICLMKPVSIISVSRFSFFLFFFSPAALHPRMSAPCSSLTNFPPPIDLPATQLTLFPLFPCL